MTIQPAGEAKIMSKIEPKFYTEDMTSRRPSTFRDLAGDRFVRVCTYAVIVDTMSQKIWLARHINRPAEGLLWWIGGALLCGLEAREGMAATFFRETSLSVEPRRFLFVDMVRYLLRDRLTETHGIGFDQLTYTFYVELSADERLYVATQLDPNEYVKEFGLHEFTRADLVSYGVHPVILDTYDKVFPPTYDVA
ncbi:MAG: hypothetical protein HY981_03505 [Candidatus Magasanikbacteria bacterium]|nr:hypothetical protein [Candidatus Magasanikbacteria bacterium]